MSDNLGNTPQLFGEGSPLDTDVNFGATTNEVDLGFEPRVERVGALEAGVDKALASQSRAASVLAGKLGLDETASDLAQYSEEKYAEWRKFNPKVASYKDIKSLGQLMDYIGEGLATGAPEVAAMFFGRLGLVANAASYFGDTVNQQIEAGEEIDVGRAMVTAGAESLLNIPITKAMKGMLAKLDKTNLTEEAKKNVLTDLAKNFAVDGGTNGAQQVLRNYGVTGEISTEDIDEAIVGGMLVSAPLRVAQATVDKAKQAELAEMASDHAVKTGDIAGADGFMQSALNFTMGTALRPVRRFLEGTEAGQEINKRIETMRVEREVMAAEMNNRIDTLFSAVKDADKLRKDYAEGRRDTAELRELDSILNDIHARANSKQGANLDTGYINNYLPTIMDPETFDIDGLQNQYTRWYNEQVDKTTVDSEGNVKPLVTPEENLRKIKAFKVALEKQDTQAAKMPRVTIDENGNITAPNRVETTSPLKYGQLENSRQLSHIPQHILNDYSVSRNFKEQLLNYAQSAAHRITYAEQLGKNNEILNGLIAQANSQRGNAQAMTTAEVDTFYNAMDAYQGTYGQFQSESAKKLASVARSISNVVALPLTALSSLTEPFNLFIKVGNVAGTKALIKTLGSASRDLISTFTGGIVDKSETNRQLLMTGRSFKNATTALNNRIQGEFLSPAMQNFNNAFFHATGQTVINYLVNSMAVHAMDAQLKTDLTTINSRPKNTRAYVSAVERLNDLGISESIAQAMNKNPNIIDEYKPSMVARFNRDVALNPEALDKPIWFSTGWGAMFTQLRGYPTMFTNTILPKLYDLIDPRGKSGAELAVDLARFSATTGAVLFVGFLQESIKNEVRGNVYSDEELFNKAYQNTLMPSHMQILWGAANGQLSRSVVPPSFSIFDKEVGVLNKAYNGELELEDLPIISAFKGVL
ncbi:phage particle protein [Vibrio phage KIT05]|nr:phage particle protein [Vibrio phage KIT05]